MYQLQTHLTQEMTLCVNSVTMYPRQGQLLKPPTLSNIFCHAVIYIYIYSAHAPIQGLRPL